MKISLHKMEMIYSLSARTMGETLSRPKLDSASVSFHFLSHLVGPGAQ